MNFIYWKNYFIFVHYNVHIKLKVMRVISSAELRNNMKKYLDLARHEKIVVQRGKNETFVLTKEEYLKPDEDFARAITMDELLIRVKKDIHKMFKEEKIKE